MNFVLCYDDHGVSRSVPVESITFRPAVHGILIEQGHVLLMRHPVTRLWQPPGRILSCVDTPGQAMRHYFRKVTGMIPVLGPLLLVEDQYRVDAQNEAWHLSLLYYALERPATGTMIAAESADDFGPTLVPLDRLRRNEMQFGYDAVQAGRVRSGM